MKKTVVLLVFILLVSSGCSDNSDLSNEQMKIYQDFKNTLMTNNGTPTYDIPFSYKMEVDELEGEGYSYTVIVDNPLIIMNQLQMMILDVDTMSQDLMAPSLGILEDTTYSLVPNQVDVERGYPEGVALNGLTKEKNFTIFCVVSWYLEDHSTQKRAFFSFQVVDGEVVNDSEVIDNE